MKYNGEEYIVIDMGTYQNVLVLKPIIAKKKYSEENGIFDATWNETEKN